MSSLTGLSDRILILGDEAKSAHAIERLMQSAGYSACVVSTLDQARQQINSHSISLLILELTASRVTGSLMQPSGHDSGESLRRLDWAQEALNFCREIKNDAATTELPIIVVSKSQRARDKVACLNAGATDYLIKPYQRAEFLSRVNSHLRSYHSERKRSARFEQLNVLHSVSSVLASTLDPEVLLSETLSVLATYLRSDAAVVYHANGQSLGIIAAKGLAITDGVRSDLATLCSTANFAIPGPQLVEPIPESLRAALHRETSANARFVCLPLVLKGNSTGVLCLFFSQESSLPRQDLDLLATIGNQLSVALENARLFVETKKSAAQLSFVYNLGNNLMNSLEMDELLGYAVFTVGKSLACDACAVIVKGSSGRDAIASALYAPCHDPKAVASDWYRSERVQSYLLTNDGAAQSIETHGAERFLNDPAIQLETTVPIIFDDKLMGMLICGSRSQRPFTADDQKLLGAVAQQLSLAIRNTELYRQTKDTSINLAVEVAYRTQEIEEQKRFTEKIIDSLPVSLYVVDRDMRIVAWNRNREIGGLGASREEVLGKNVFSVLTRQPRRVLEDEFVQVLRSGEIVRMEQESWFDGQKKVWKISKIPMRVDNAEVTHVITVGEDITEQKKMNEAVIHAEKLASIGRLAAGVVHEINNPLATIAACAEALSTRVDELSEQELNNDFSEYLRIIRDEAFRCKSITNSLLEFSHQRQAEKNPIDVNQIIEQTLMLIKHHPKLGNIRVVKDLDLSLAPAHVNEGQMKQVFIALISNAYDAMSSEGTLTIRTRECTSNNGWKVCVEFCDTGCGIPASHLAKIFDPFFTTKPLGRGTGLGLSVCYGIVSEHGGTIDVESKEGEGSTFRVMLPLSRTRSKPSHSNNLRSAGRIDRPEHQSVLEMEGAL